LLRCVLSLTSTAKGVPSMKTRWILISDASRARLFREDSRVRDYELVASYEHAESRAHERDIVANGNGKSTPPPRSSPHGGHASSGGFGRSAPVADADPKEFEAVRFARQLSDVLARGLNDHAYNALIVAAPPKFLGVLKESLTLEVSKHVEVALNKDLTKLGAREIQVRVREER
jgi:protein required for attachment to host cells